MQADMLTKNHYRDQSQIGIITYVVTIPFLIVMLRDGNVNLMYHKEFVYHKQKSLSSCV